MRQSLGSLCWQRLRRNRIGLLSLGILALFAGMALFAPLLATHDPQAVDLSSRLQEPGGTYFFGTDQLGRCVYSRVVYGAQISLSMAVLILAISLAVSLPLGMITGYQGGLLDQLVMRVVDSLLAFPIVILALAIAALLGPGLDSLAAALGAVWWMHYARVIRGVTLAVKEKEFVMAARVAGSGTWAILWRHILPHVVSTVIVLATLDMGKLVITLAGLSFLGLGAQPSVPEWGSMLNDGRPYFQTAWYLMLFPGLAIGLLALSSNLFGDALRDIMHPQGMTPVD